MAQLIDTSVFISLERRSLPVSALVAAVADEPIAVAAITASELLVGVLRADMPARRLRRGAFVSEVLAALPVLAFDLQVARVHAALWVELLTAGQMIGAHDMQIAATALAHGYAVVTANRRDFDRIPGLVVRQPAWST
ncbi:MAG: PIN domain-containing protein [Chloroflexi bacterium]|nr:PIN domain-containing protein [Chloroflexota bacterium]